MAQQTPKWRVAIFDHSKHANGKNPFVYFEETGTDYQDFYDNKLVPNYPKDTYTYLTAKRIA